MMLHVAVLMAKVRYSGTLSPAQSSLRSTIDRLELDESSPYSTASPSALLLRNAGFEEAEGGGAYSSAFGAGEVARDRMHVLTRYARENVNSRFMQRALATVGLVPDDASTVRDGVEAANALEGREVRPQQPFAGSTTDGPKFRFARRVAAGHRRPRGRSASFRRKMAS